MVDRFNIRRRSAIKTYIELCLALNKNIMIFEDISISIINYPQISFISHPNNFPTHSFISVNELIDILIVQKEINTEDKILEIETWIIENI